MSPDPAPNNANNNVTEIKANLTHTDLISKRSAIPPQTPSANIFVEDLYRPFCIHSPPSIVIHRIFS